MKQEACSTILTCSMHAGIRGTRFRGAHAQRPDGGASGPANDGTRCVIKARPATSLVTLWPWSGSLSPSDHGPTRELGGTDMSRSAHIRCQSHWADGLTIALPCISSKIFSLSELPASVLYLSWAVSYHGWTRRAQRNHKQPTLMAL